MFAPFRFLAALFALWFAAVLGDPGVLHACPMHGGHGTTHSGAMASSHGRPAEHAAHAAAAHEAATSADASQQQDASGPCTCVGHCCAAPAAAPVPTVTAIHVPEAVAEVRHPLPAPSIEAVASPDLRLPFPNGPPTA